MSQPVKLSDNLVAEARSCADIMERSIASQIEFWAELGKAIEPLLRFDEVLALKKSGKDIPLSQCIAEIDTPVGRQRLEKVLEQEPFPHYEGVEGFPDRYVRIEADGTRRTGRFINRRFVEM